MASATFNSSARVEVCQSRVVASLEHGCRRRSAIMAKAQVALAAGLGGEQGIEAEAADGAEHGLDMAVGEGAFDVEGQRAGRNFSPAEGAADEIDEVGGQVGDVAEGFVLDLGADTEGSAQEVGVVEPCPCRCAMWWPHERCQFLMAYPIIGDRTRECKRKMRSLVATFGRSKLRQLIDAVGIDLFHGLELRSGKRISPSRPRSNRELIAKAEAIDSPQRVVLDMDSTEIPVYGQQENSAYNGHFESTCYHPLLLFNREGDCLAAKLRSGNVHSADGWEDMLLPEIERQQKLGKEVVFRADAAFAKPEIYEALEERGVDYAIRLPANECLEIDIDREAKMEIRAPG